MKIVDLFSTQIQIFSLGKISYRMLSQREVLSQFVEMFSLTPSEEKIGRSELKFANGRFEISGKKIHIDSISIDPRKIVVKVSGTTSDAHEIMNRMMSFISENDFRNEASYIPSAEPIITTNESMLVFSHTTQFEKLLHKSVLDRVPQDWKKEISSQARVHIEPVAIAWRIWFDQLPNELVEQHVTLADKQLLIQYQGKTKDGNHLYALSAPVETDKIKQLAQYIGEWLSHK